MREGLHAYHTCILLVQSHDCFLVSDIITNTVSISPNLRDDFVRCLRETWASMFKSWGTFTKHSDVNRVWGRETWIRGGIQIAHATSTLYQYSRVTLLLRRHLTQVPMTKALPSSSHESRVVLVRSETTNVLLCAAGAGCKQFKRGLKVCRQLTKN